MQLRIFTEPQQGATYSTLLAAAKASEDGGFDAFFRSDHYLHMGDVTGLPGPTDAWVTLGALARETSRIRLGTLVTAATFRLPGPLAIAVAQVDDMSGGRIELGLGTGWYDGEHAAYGIPFPSVKERFQLFEEQLEIVTGLWRTPVGESFSFAGDHYQVVDSPGLPKPVQAGGPPIIIGGGGQKKTPRLAARFATEFNLPFVPMDFFTHQIGVVARACEAIDRDPASLINSVAQVVVCGTDEAEIERRAAAIGREVDELRANGLCGTPSELVDRINAWGERGAARVYLQVLDLEDLDHIALLAAEVLPNV